MPIEKLRNESVEDNSVAGCPSPKSDIRNPKETRNLQSEGFTLKTEVQTAKHAKYAKGKELNRTARSPVG